MKISMNLSAMSQEMCIELVRNIVDMKVSATIQLEAKSVELDDVNESAQVTALIPSIFSKLTKIEMKSNVDEKFNNVAPSEEECSVKSKKTKSLGNKRGKKNSYNQEKLSDAISEYDDLIRIFGNTLEKMRNQECIQPGNYESAFANVVLGVSSDSEIHSKIACALSKLKSLKHNSEALKMSQVKELITQEEYAALYERIRYTYKKNGVNKTTGRAKYVNMIKLYLNFLNI